MKVDSQFDYTIFMMFEVLYKYENKKSISLDKIIDFRRILLEEILRIYKEGKHEYLSEIDKWEGTVTFKNIDENLELKRFLEQYKYYFDLSNNEISLKEYITYNDIMKILIDIRAKNNVPHRFDIILDSKKLRDILDVSSMEKIIKEYYNIEQKIEKLYYKLYSKDDSDNLRKEIQKLLLARFAFLSRVGSMPDYKVDAFTIISKICKEDYTKNDFYDTYPIDLKLWNDQDEVDLDNFSNDIDSRVYDITQYAIFGKLSNKLYKDKVSEDLDSLFMSDEFLISDCEEQFDPNIDYTKETENDLMKLEQFQETYENNPDTLVEMHDPTEEFWVLYMNYLNNINKYMKVYGELEKLQLAKKRLLYALDKPLLMIFDENNFKKELEKTKEIELDDESFDFFVDEIYFIASEVFRVPINEYTLRKLILVGTYYNLTNDAAIKDTVDKYKNDSRYDFFYDIMINNCASIITDNNKLPNDVKKLILRPNDNKVDLI